MKNLYLSVFLIIGICMICKSQTSVDASGGYAKSGNYSFSYSIGEVATATLRSSDGSYFATSGVIQPDPLLILNVDETYLDQQVLLPNPVNNILHFYPGVLADASFIIYRYDGSFITSGKLISSAIDVREFSSGLYYIQLRDTKSRLFKIFQFVKT